MKYIIVITILFLLGCSQSSVQLSDEFDSNSNMFKRVIADLHTRYTDYSNYFDGGLSNGSLLLNSRIVMDSSLKPISLSGQFLLKRQDIEITVLDSNTIWFRRELNNSFFKVESELLIYSEKNKTYLDSVIHFRYSEQSDLQTLESNWYFVNVTRHVD